MEKPVLHLSQDPTRANTALINAECPIQKSEGRRGAKKAEFCSFKLFLLGQLHFHTHV